MVAGLLSLCCCAVQIRGTTCTARHRSHNTNETLSFFFGKKKRRPSPFLVPTIPTPTDSVSDSTSPYDSLLAPYDHPYSDDNDEPDEFLSTETLQDRSAEAIRENE